MEKCPSPFTKVKACFMQTRDTSDEACIVCIVVWSRINACDVHNFLFEAQLGMAGSHC